MSTPELKFAISDLHLFHNNILKFTNRPYSSLDEMHQDIVDEWNDVIPKGAVVYHLGDLSFLKAKKMEDQKPLYEILNRLNGTIVFLKGNHDYSNYWKHHKEAVEAGLLKNGRYFEDSPYKEVRVRCEKIKTKFVMCHYPIISWNMQHHGSIHIHGHCHNSLNHNLGRAMDVGLDALLENHHHVHPINFMDVVDVLDSTPTMVVDHHNPNRLD
jgi:calcineurin-like phosphoesterase family protein